MQRRLARAARGDGELHLSSPVRGRAGSGMRSIRVRASTVQLRPRARSVAGTVVDSSTGTVHARAWTRSGTRKVCSWSATGATRSVRAATATRPAESRARRPHGDAAARQRRRQAFAGAQPLAACEPGQRTAAQAAPALVDRAAPCSSTRPACGDSPAAGRTILGAGGRAGDPERGRDGARVGEAVVDGHPHAGAARRPRGSRAGMFARPRLGP